MSLGAELDLPRYRIKSINGNVLKVIIRRDNDIKIEVSFWLGNKLAKN